MKTFKLTPINESWKKVAQITWAEEDFQAIKAMIKPQLKEATLELGLTLTADQLQAAFETIHSLPIYFRDVVIKGTTTSIAIYKREREASVSVSVSEE